LFFIARSLDVTFLLRMWGQTGRKTDQKALPSMRFPNLTPQTEIDAQLRRTKPLRPAAPTVPWLPALCGLSLLLALQTLL
jgi:hypothetical protein